MPSRTTPFLCLDCGTPIHRVERSGLQRCSICRAARNKEKLREWRQKNTDRVKAHYKKWRKTEHGRRYHTRATNKRRRNDPRWKAKSAELSRRWKQLNPEKARASARKSAARRRDRAKTDPVLRDTMARSHRRWQLKKHFGLTEAQFSELQERQGHTCAVCKLPPKRFVVDHDHATNKVRELLCDNCNIAIGHLQDSPERAEAVKQYLLRHQQNT